MSAALHRRDIDMTAGSITKHLILFALPMLLGNIFQQLYNTVDSIVVGTFVGKEALAAVGTVGPIINMLIGFFNGFASGAGVIISRAYGAHDRAQLRSAIHTAMGLTLLLSVLLTALGVSLAPAFLRMMKTPDDVLSEAAAYLRIYFAGATGLLFYNIGAGILRAVGDSMRPLYFLIFSAVVNTALDLLFVAVFGWGIVGVAVATVAAQLLSALLVMIILTREQADYRVELRSIRLERETLSHILTVGLPTAVQMAITSFSNVFVQSYINRFGASCIAGWTVFNKVDAFILLPAGALSLADTTFVGQNIGAGDIERAKKGTSTTMRLSFLTTFLLLVPTMLFSRQLVTIFNSDPEVLTYGTRFILTITPFYLTVVVSQTIAGSLRGAGDAKACMYIILGSYVVFRQIYLFVVYRIWGTLLLVSLGYPMGWIVGSVAIYIYYKSNRWKKAITYLQTEKAGKD